MHLGVLRRVDDPDDELLRHADALLGATVSERIDMKSCTLQRERRVPPGREIVGEGQRERRATAE